MNQKIHDMVTEIETMKEKLKQEIAKEETKASAYRIEGGSVIFDKESLLKQRAHMKHLWAWFKEVPLIQLMTAPVIYGMVIPAVILDAFLFVYVRVVAPVFKLKFAKRGDFIVFDRHYLGYLNFFEKLNCVYCSYFNGLMFYAGSVAQTTELYFCPIKHAKRVAYGEEHFSKYIGYGDAEKYHDKLNALREKYTGQKKN